MRSHLALATSHRRYRPISDYGAIGEGRSVALVSSDGSVDWWCPGRFDAPSVFAAILDERLGGRFRLAPALRSTSRMRYVADTNVLETEHHVATGAVRVVDFAPFPEDTGVEDAVLIRRVVGLSGQVAMETLFSPRFAYGQTPPRFSRDRHGLVARGAGQLMLLEGPEPGIPAEGGRRGAFTVEADQSVDIVLRHRNYDTPGTFGEPLREPPAELERRTIARWKAWSDRTEFDGPEAPMVKRSALVLKLLQYRPTGAFVAAPTTSLPEELGGVRNWDYRYAWLRDAAWMARALGDTGHVDEARQFRDWAIRTIEEDGGDLHIMYTIGGSPDLPERVLPHLEGYRGSRPVRVGNGAVEQRQLDVYGEVLDFVQTVSELDNGVPDWPILQGLADWVADHWTEPDSGIWEMRCEPRHFVLSKAFAWVALDRVVNLARRNDLPGDVGRWAGEAARIRDEVLDRGFDAGRGAFIQAYGFPVLDASNLLLPLIGFLDAEDPRMVGTVDATLETLTVNGLVYRYLASDGLPGAEATFAYCTFWLIEVLALQNRLELARQLFDRMAQRASPLGLYAEEIDPVTGEHMGNYPQGFPHIGLINAARTLRRMERCAAAASSSGAPSPPA